MYNYVLYVSVGSSDCNGATDRSTIPNGGAKINRENPQFMPAPALNPPGIARVPGPCRGAPGG